eukprot:Plantae.Rhodophyta-Purpureofilum_apyrenoidigerum.ctg42707.p1 GENE.Plantae.Rhodophyta-Purpureofilum_apyrenoidigerum.ctg42707~~Plantae.Rhodophyta-Purpureofilum_apyrenoidigerum.ctg42707.p1  ORF type:complete len:196 (-),score=41.77 Plantae.Rhodophyta-Purpureofilum_apyrenoidigerum.ctg42707:2-589(-)
MNRTMDSAVDLDLSRLSHGSAKFKDTTLGRLDKEIERLTKANFDLQLQVLAWEESMGDAEGDGELKRKSNSRFVTLMEEKQRELEDKDRYLVKARDIIYKLVAMNDGALSTEMDSRGGGEISTAALDKLACFNEGAENELKIPYDKNQKTVACTDEIHRLELITERQKAEQLQLENKDLKAFAENLSESYPRTLR